MLGSLQQNSVAVTVGLAFLGYVATYLNSIRLERRRARLARVNDQLQYLYGPLFSLSQASFQAWKTFRSRCRPGAAFFDPKSPPSDRELAEWRMWMTHVFMPINLKMEQAITDNAHLVEEDRIPHEFLDFIAHIEVYKIVARKWGDGSFDEHLSYSAYPKTLDAHVERMFGELKKRQARLIN